MLVHVAPERHHKPHKVIIRQLYKGREAGRIPGSCFLSATGTDRTGFLRKAEACCSLYKRNCRLGPASCALQEFRVPGIANGCQRLLVEVVGVAVELAERNDIAVNIG